MKIWRSGSLTVKNRRNVAASISIFSAIEFCLWDALDDATNFQRNFNIAEAEIESGVFITRPSTANDAIISRTSPVLRKSRASILNATHFSASYRGWENPVAVERGSSCDSVAHGWAPIGSHHVKIDLAPGESRQLIFVLGYQENPKDRNSIRRIRRPSTRSQPNRDRNLPRSLQCRRCFRTLVPIGTTCLAFVRLTLPMFIPIAWSTSGIPTSAWRRLTFRVRRRSTSRESGAALASAIPIKICWAPFT